jgi:hypothetical protein
MFGLGSIRKSTQPSERLRLVGLDLNSSRARAVAIGKGYSRLLLLDDPNEELPLYVTLDQRNAGLGHAGLAVCRKIPHSVCSNFLPLLGTRHEWRDRLTLNPESALSACLERLVQPIAAETDAAALGLPSYLSIQQVRTILELATAAQLPIRGSVCTALALAAHRAGSVGPGTRGTESTVLVIDVDEYALTASLIGIGTHEVQLFGSMASPKASQKVWKNRLIDGLSSRCVRVCRRDPRDSADAEQDLYLQLDQLLEGSRQSRSNTVTVRSERWYQDLTVSPDELEAICAPINRVAIDDLKQFLMSTNLDVPPRAVWLTHAAGRLPGLAAKIYKHSPEQTQVSLLPANAGAEAAAALVPRWLNGNLSSTYLDAIIPHQSPLELADDGPSASIGLSVRQSLPRKVQ